MIENLLLLTLTIAVFYPARLLYDKTGKFPLLHPILTSITVIMAVLKLWGTTFESYYEANRIINFMLGLSVVALGYLLHENISHLKGRAISILTSVFMGSLAGVCAVILLSYAFGIGEVITASLQPKSVTTPIALAISESTGGIPALTSLAVIVTGLFGSIFGPWLLKTLRITDPVARGLAMGTASHAVGTARAMEMGAIEGAVGGVAIGLAGLFTAIIIPILTSLLS